MNMLGYLLVRDLYDEPYRQTYDLSNLSPRQVSELNLGPKVDGAQPAVADCNIVQDLRRFPPINFEKALRLVTFLSKSQRAGDRILAASGLQNLTSEAERRNAWTPDMAAVWAALLTDDHPSPREISHSELDELRQQRLMRRQVLSDIDDLIADLIA